MRSDNLCVETMDMRSDDPDAARGRRTPPTLLGTIVDGSVRTWQRYQRRRAMHAIYGALRELDDRTLHDLGFHRSEILSVAAEATGEAEWTRVRVPLRPRAPR